MRKGAHAEKGGSEMKKSIMKKIMAVTATMVMTLSLIVNPSIKAEAATSYAYLVGINGTEWGMDHVLTSTDDVNYSGEIEFSAGGDISILMTENDWNSAGKITSWNEDTTVFNKDGRDAVWFLKEGNKAGVYTVSYNKDTGAVTAALKDESTTVWTYSYYVAGESGFEAEYWSNSDPSTYSTKGKMTEDGAKYVYKAVTSESFDGSAGYNIVKIGTPDNGGKQTIEWLKNGSEPYLCEYSGVGALTISYDIESGEVICEFVEGVTGETDASKPTEEPTKDSTTADNDEAGKNTSDGESETRYYKPIETTTKQEKNSNIGLIMAILAVVVVVAVVIEVIVISRKKKTAYSDFEEDDE